MTEMQEILDAIRDEEVIGMFVDHPDRMRWWQDMEAVPRGAGRGATFRSDREDYATMAQTMRDQGRLPFDEHETALPCDMASCGV